jgi:predicted DNA-binding protein
MTNETELPATAIEHHLSRPTFSTNEDGVVQIETNEPTTLINLFNVETFEAASGLMTCALNALGRSGENYRDMMAAMLAELKPRDAVEAMLITQMTTTHVALTSLSQKMVDTSSGYQVREALERSMTRLSRTYLAQMDALKKYRAKAQQVVRVERVTVHEGGQAIVGDVSHGEKACGGNCR